MRPIKIRKSSIVLLFLCIILPGCNSSSQKIEDQSVITVAPSPTSSSPASTQLPVEFEITATSKAVGANDGCNGYLRAPYFPVDEIKEWSENYRKMDGFCGNKLQVLGIAFGRGEWVVTLDRENDFGDQQFLINKDIPVEEIARLNDEDYRITAIACDGINWAIVLSENTGFLSQQIEVYTALPEAEIEAMREDGFWVTDIAYGNGVWVVVYSTTDLISDQEIQISTSFPRDEVSNRTADGYYLTGQAYGADTWVLVLSKLSKNIQTQYIYVSHDFQKDNVQQLWFTSSNYFYIKPFFGEDMWFINGIEEIR